MLLLLLMKMPEHYSLWRSAGAHAQIKLNEIKQQQQQQQQQQQKQKQHSHAVVAVDENARALLPREKCCLDSSCTLR